MPPGMPPTAMVLLVPASVRPYDAMNGMASSLWPPGRNYRVVCPRYQFQKFDTNASPDRNCLAPMPSITSHRPKTKSGRSAMATIVGTGDFKYRIVEDWAKLPDGWSFKEVGAVGVDASDNVYVFNRGEHPMMVFDRNGAFL